MKNWKAIAGSAAFVTLMSSTAAFADVSAKEVWDDWRLYMSGMGYKLTSNDTLSDGKVTVDDLVMEMKIPEEDDTLTVSLGQITFTDQGDGSVAVGFAPDLPVKITVDDEFAATLKYTHQAMDMIVSGAPEEMRYDYTAAAMGVELVDLMMDGKELHNAVFNVNMQGVAGEATNIVADLRKVAESFSAKSVTYDIAMKEPRGDSSFKIKGDMADLAGKFTASMPSNVNFEKMAQTLSDGFAFAGGFSWGSGGYELSTSDGGDTMQGKTQMRSGSFDVKMDREQLMYASDAKGIKASISGNSIPLPSIDYQLGSAGFKLLMPVSKSQKASDFSFAINLDQLSVSEAIWGLFDPSAVLPRDPATIRLALDGKANWLVDIMDPKSSKKADVPGQLHALTLKELQLSIAGADLTGSGDFTFDNSDLETFDGLPAPEGEVNLELTGGNGLLDNLIKMGLVPQDQAMGVRMMIGMFAVVGDGPDTLTSKIEVKSDGSILANGQRLK
ncbi:MAG: DUF2125 domain-containing protein [Rhodobacterales bacterium]|nr:MAG: DUF2125 domain-containing protein [Rhodobacterales bacterium]